MPPQSAGLWSPGRRALTTGLVLTVTLVASEALAVANDHADRRSRPRRPATATSTAGSSPAFFLGSLVGIVVAGLLIDRGSLVRPFALGLALFSIGLLVGGLAPSMQILVAGAGRSRASAPGAIPAVAYVAIGRALPEPLRPRMFATLSTAWVLPGLIGPRSRPARRRGVPLAARLPRPAAADRRRGGR